MSRTVIDVDDKLMKQAQKLSGLKKKVDVINLALEELVETEEIRRVLEMHGKLKGRGSHE